MAWVNIHRHDMFSLFDGFGRAENAAEYAKSLGQTALGLTNHGNVCGLIEHYTACKAAEVKPLLGVEAYFQPKFDKQQPRYHLTLLAKNLEGYHNLMRMISHANRETFYKTPNVDMETLEKYGKGVIVMTACVAGFVPRLILGNHFELGEKAVRWFKKRFGDDFFFEVMPIYLPSQKIVNEKLIKWSEKYDVKVVMTMDSHFVAEEDYDTYQVMHKLAQSYAQADYSKRFMPNEKFIKREWRNMHPDINPIEYMENAEYVASMCDVDLTFSEMVPKLEWGMSSRDKLKQLAAHSLKKLGKWDDKYKEQLKKELKVIFDKKFEDYFLLCYDIVNYAKTKGIGVGFGRGSVCGSLLAYAIGLTQVDPLILKTDFERFLRPNRNTMPDIDMDFESTRRGEVVDYILKKYEGKAAPITAFGYYRVKNLLNDLDKLYGGIDKRDMDHMRDRLNEICGGSEVHLLMSYVTFDDLYKHKDVRKLNVRYPDLMKHFAKLYGQVRFIGRHAAGVAIAVDDIEKYTALMRVRDTLQTSYDFESLGKINMLKIDILGLATVSLVSDVNRLTGEQFRYNILNDKMVYKAFTNGETDGIFQFEKAGAKHILAKVKPRNMQDLIACNALNRPAPIELGILDEYLDGKAGDVDTTKPWYKYTADTYGAIVYQEHVMRIAKQLAQLDWDDIDKILKLWHKVVDPKDPLRMRFVQGAVRHGGMTEEAAADLYNKMTMYLFNKGHGAGYSLLSFYCMYLKLYHSLEYFYALLKNEPQDIKREVYKADAVRHGVVILLPHVNGSVDYSIIEIDGHKVIQEGLASVKGVGRVSATEIVKLGPYKNKAEFIAKVPKKYANVRVIKALEDIGALEFDKKKFYNRVIRYNSSLVSKNFRAW